MAAASINEGVPAGPGIHRQMGAVEVESGELSGAMSFYEFTQSGTHVVGERGLSLEETTVGQ